VEILQYTLETFRLQTVTSGLSNLELSSFLLHADGPLFVLLLTAEEEAADAFTGGYHRYDSKALQTARRTYMAKNESDS